MSKLSLLHAVCGVAILASVPAFAQPQRPGVDLVSPSGVPNPDAKQPTTGPLAPQNNGVNTTSMASPPATTGSAAKSGMDSSMKSGMDSSTKSGMDSSTKSGMGSSAMADKHPMHHEAMMHKTMGGKTDTSQDAAVDRLNDQSYKAATQGEAFKVAGSEGMSQSSAPVRGGAMSSGSMTNPTK